MNWLQRHPLMSFLAFAAAALAAVIVAELVLGSGTRTLGSGRKVALADSKLLPPPLMTSPDQAYPQTAERPLFTPTRRPAPAQLEAAKATMVKGQFVLQGVTIAGDTRIAMLREKSNGRVHRVESGREVNGIKVVDIKPDVVTLAMGGEQELVSMSVQRAGNAPPGAAPAGPFAGATGAPAPVNAPPPVPGAALAAPMPNPGGIPNNPFTGQPNMPNPAAQPQQPGMAANPAARAVPEAANAPMTPEELLARRRARRLQQQNQ